MKKFSTLRYAASAALMMLTAGAMQAQDLLAEKPVFALGEPKTWTSSEDVTYQFKTEDLAKLTKVPVNTDNVFLFAEFGDKNTDANIQLGAQSFYVDMGATNEVKIVTTTWEGAACDEYKIYLTEAEPTIAILETTPTYEATGLGQYSSNQAVLPDGSKGRYLVFQPVKATNWTWGIKIRSIQALPPADDVLTTFSVSPSFAALGVETPVTFSFKNQNGLEISVDKVTVTVTDNATLADGKLTINSGESATLTATMGGESLQAVVYAPTAPAVPELASIRTPVYTNGMTDDNATVEWGIVYNGGAVNLGQVTFENGEVAQGFGVKKADDSQCVFISNSATTGSWDADIDPTAKGYRSLHLDIFATEPVTGNVEFERTVTIGDKHPFTLEAGKWNSVDVVLTGETMLHTMSVRFDKDNATDFMLANIYFTPAFIEGDEEAPVLSDITANPTMTSVELEFSATDDKNTTVTYVITDGTNSWSTLGNSGETVKYVVNGLEPTTEYTFSVTASDGLNVSEAKTVQTKTLGFPAAEEPTLPKAKVAAIFSTDLNYGATEIPAFDSWGSAAKMTTIKDEDGNELPYFTDYDGQWGGLILGDAGVNVMNATHLHFDIFGSSKQGTIAIAPVWKEQDQTPGVKVTVEPNQWNSYDYSLTEFGVTLSSRALERPTAIQFAMTESTLADFAINNIYFYNQNTDLSSIETIGADKAAEDNAIYNLQGIRLNGHTLDTLPAGLYIIGGKKVVKN